MVVGLIKSQTEQWKLVLEAMDQNGDNKIDYAEFITAAINRDKIVSKQNLQATFKMFDTNGDGSISIDELKAVFQGSILGNEGATQEVWTKIMSEIDKDKNGVISYEEFFYQMMMVI